MPFITDRNPAGHAEARLSRRSLAALVAGISLLVLAAASAGLLAYRSTVAEHWVTHTVETREGAREVMALTLAMQGSVRGYLLTGDESFLGGYEAGTASLPQALDRLVRLTADNPRQTRVLVDLRSAIVDLLDVYRQIVAASTTEDQSALALALVRDGRGEDVMQAVRSGVDTFVDEEQGLL